MTTEEGSIVIVAPPSSGAGGGYHPGGSDEEENQGLQGAEGLVSGSPSAVQGGGVPFAQLQELMTIIDNLRRENTDLRNNLTDQNLVIQHKSRNLEQINENYRKYDEMVKAKHQETALKFKRLKDENQKLKEDLEKHSKAGHTRDSNGGEMVNEEVEKELREQLEEAQNRIEVLEKQGQSDGLPLDARNFETQLQAERNKVKDLQEKLIQTEDLKQKAEKRLKAAFQDLAKIREERKKDAAELQDNLVQEVNNYKQQIQSLLSELAENKRNLSLHTKKVQELHEANLQFDQVNTAYHSKLSMYEEELKKRDVHLEQMKQDYTICNQSLKQTLQRAQTEKHEKQMCEEELQRVKQSLHQVNMQVQLKKGEIDSLTARLVSMEESLESRNQQLVEANEAKNIMQVQLKQYQEDFERERQAREQSHHNNQANLMKLKTLKDQKDLLQKEVDRYAQQQAVQAFGNHRYSHPPSPVTPTSPVYSSTPSSYLPYGGQDRGYDIDEQHRQEMFGQVPNRTYQRVQEPVQQSFHCPMCGEVFAESGSLEIHVNTHFPN